MRIQFPFITIKKGHYYFLIAFFVVRTNFIMLLVHTVPIRIAIVVAQLKGLAFEVVRVLFGF